MRALSFSAPVLLFVAACTTTPTHVLDLLDVDSDSDRQAAVADAAAILRDPGRPEAVRATAAKVLGRLRSPDPDAIAALSTGSSGGGSELRSWSAWGLGELRSPASLLALMQALRAPLDAPSAEQVLEGLAKHFAVLSRDPAQIVEVVEAMIYYAGNAGSALPPVYDLVDAKTRTVEVNVTVLSRALATVSKGGNEAARAALYEATYELLARLDASRSEIGAGPEAWRGRIQAAFAESDRTLALEDRRQRALVLGAYGRMGDMPELGPTAAQLLLGKDGKLPSWLSTSELRLIGLWALFKLQLHATGARRALAGPLLTAEKDKTVLRLAADLSRVEGEPDALQKVLGLSLEERR